MTQRFLIGKHAGFGQWGAWLSVPGVDVTVAGPAANFILKPDLKYEQVVSSGLVAIGSGLTITVPFISNLILHPYIFVRANISPSNEYPHSLSLVGGSGSAATEVIIGCGINPDHMDFTNNNTYTLYAWFMVFNRSLGS